MSNPTPNNAPYQIFRTRAETITGKFRLAERILHFDIQEEAPTTELRERMRAFFDFAGDVDLWHSESPKGSQRLHEADLARRRQAVRLLDALSEGLTHLIVFLRRMVRLKGPKGEPGLRHHGRRRAVMAIDKLTPRINALEEFAREGREESDSE
ncbi:hypothetical protein BDV18DRAFT_162586 [Aspergillus unguis]